MKKKNNPNKRQEEIIKYLNEHGEVTTEEIKELFHVAKSTLSEDIKFLRGKGYPIVTRYGYISLGKQEDDLVIPYYEKLCPSIIRKWIILYNLICHYNPWDVEVEDELYALTLEELYTYCQAMYTRLAPTTDAMSDQVFFKDVRELIRDGYIKYSKNTQHALNKNICAKNADRHPVPSKNLFYFANIDKNTAFSLYDFLENKMDTAFFIDLKNLLKKYWPDINDSYVNAREKYIYTKTIPPTERNMFEHLRLLSYETNCLNITCHSEENNNQCIVYKDFETVAIIYSKDINHFFLLGRSITDTTDAKREYLLPFERIIKIQETNVPNTIHADSDILETYKSMIHSKGPDLDKWKKRYKEVFDLEYKENIGECLSTIK